HGLLVYGNQVQSNPAQADVCARWVKLSTNYLASTWMTTIGVIQENQSLAKSSQCGFILSIRIHSWLWEQNQKHYLLPF
ncbi:MAG: hypothetical protein WD022_03290, partial [Balneolaceae bacterium]